MKNYRNKKQVIHIYYHYRYHDGITDQREENGEKLKISIMPLLNKQNNLNIMNMIKWY